MRPELRAPGWSTNRLWRVELSIVTLLAAMRSVPRDRFVPPHLAAAAYDDRPLPIGFGQTISQPFIVAYMTQALRLGPGHRVLEIGTGSGYQAAVLAHIVKEVHTIEIVPELADRSRALFRELGYTNIHVLTGDGMLACRRERRSTGSLSRLRPTTCQSR